MLLATSSERQGRMIDHDEAGSMEKKKQEGYSNNFNPLKKREPRKRFQNLWSLSMSHQSDLISQDILAYLKQHEKKTYCAFDLR
jgi:hypothetical protein